VYLLAAEVTHCPGDICLPTRSVRTANFGSSCPCLVRPSTITDFSSEYSHDLSPKPSSFAHNSWLLPGFSLFIPLEPDFSHLLVILRRLVYC
jgi:hypothetical protein